MSEIRVGIVGFGKIAQNVHLPLMQAVGGFRVEVVASSRPDHVHAVLPDAQVVAGIDELVTHDLDLVLIATPNQLHASLAITALQGGKNVIVEKPFTLTVDEAEQVVSAAESAGRFVTVFQNRQFDSDFIGLQNLLADGLIGEIKTLECNYNRYRPEVKDRWREDGSAGSGLWYDLGPHLVDQVVRVMGMPESVTADLLVSRQNGSSDDWFLADLAYPSARALLRADSFDAGGGFRFVVRGTKATAYKVHSDVQEDQLAAGLRPGDTGWGVDVDPWVIVDGATDSRTEYPSGVGCEQRFYEDVAAHIATGSPLPVTVPSALATMQIIDAGLASARTGTRISLNRQ